MGVQQRIGHSSVNAGWSDEHFDTAFVTWETNMDMHSFVTRNTTVQPCFVLSCCVHSTITAVQPDTNWSHEDVQYQ